VRVLSGGERSRLALLKMLLHPANLLVLDEPTNHLDLDSKDVLLDALKRFDGTVLFVSHDRFFIEELADRVLELSCGASPRLYYGDYAYYLSKKAEGESPRGNTGVSGSRTSSGLTIAPKDAKASREEDKKRKVERNRLKKREEEILARLEAIDGERSETERSMGLPENYSDGSRMKTLQASSDALEAESGRLSAEWEIIASELEAYADLDQGL
jgi:ATP-binding cassette, subfamily F, member 3